MVIRSGPGAPRFAFTFFQAFSMLASATTASINDPGIKLKAGFSIDADTVGPGRDSEPVVSRTGRVLGCEGLPRFKSIDGSSLFFIVWSFPTRLAFERWYYDLC
jgi:hypothetical protein